MVRCTLILDTRIYLLLYNFHTSLTLLYFNFGYSSSKQSIIWHKVITYSFCDLFKCSTYQKIHIVIIRAVAWWSLVAWYRRFGGICSPHLKGITNKRQKHEKLLPWKIKNSCVKKIILNQSCRFSWDIFYLTYNSFVQWSISHENDIQFAFHCLIRREVSFEFLSKFWLYFIDASQY